MGEDMPGRRVLFNMLKGLFHKHPVRVDIAGTVESIAKITPELLYRCYYRYYNLHNMVLVVAGRITPEEVMDACDRLLKPAEEWVPDCYTIDEPATPAVEYVEDKMAVAAPLFYIGFKEPSVSHTPKTLAGARLLIDLISGKSSPLYTRLLEEGLINDQFEVEYFGGPDYGIWLVGGESSDPKRVKDMFAAEIVRLQREGLDAALVEAVRRGAYGRLVAGLDDPSDCAELILSHLVDGVEPLSELNALAEITLEELQEQLATRFDAAACTLSVVNPV